MLRERDLVGWVIEEIERRSRKSSQKPQKDIHSKGCFLRFWIAFCGFCVKTALISHPS